MAMAKKPRSDAIQAGNREIAVTNAAKVLFPGPKYTKLDLVRYYLEVAEDALAGACYSRITIKTSPGYPRAINSALHPNGGQMNKFTAVGLLTAFVASGSLAHDLKVDADESLAMVAPAKGVQIYECRQTSKGQEGGYHGYQWAFVAPEADLFDTRGARIGHHYAGPQWEGADGSRVIGAVKARADAPTKGAIPWLLLGTQSVGAKGAFSGVSSIRRVNTVGGLAPSEPCTAAQAGKLERVPYTADYYFFTRN